MKRLTIFTLGFFAMLSAACDSSTMANDPKKMSGESKKLSSDEKSSGSSENAARGGSPAVTADAPEQTTTASATPTSSEASTNAIIGNQNTVQAIRSDSPVIVPPAPTPSPTPQTFSSQDCLSGAAVVDANARYVLATEPEVRDFNKKHFYGAQWDSCPSSYDAGVAQVICRIAGYHALAPNGIGWEQFNTPENDCIYFLSDGKFVYHNAADYNMMLSKVECVGKLADSCVKDKSWIPGAPGLIH